MKRTGRDSGYIMPAVSVMLFMVSLASVVTVRGAANRWLADQEGRRASDEAAVAEYAWPEITYSLRSMRDPTSLEELYGDWQAFGGGSCESGSLPDPPETLDCWKVTDVELRELPSRRNDLPFQLATIRVLTRVDCSTADPPDETTGGCSLAGESERTYRRRSLLYFQAHFSDQAATPRAPNSTGQPLAFTTGDELDHMHFAGNQLVVCGQPVFHGVVELAQGTTVNPVYQVCGGSSPALNSTRVPPLQPGRTIVGSATGCAAGSPWLDDAQLVGQPPPGTGVDLGAVSDGDVYYSTSPITVYGLNTNGASVTVASPAGIVVDLSAQPIMGTGQSANAQAAGLHDLGDISALPGGTFTNYDENLGHTDGAVRWFRFTLETPQEVELWLRQMQSGSDALLVLEDPNGVEIASSRGDRPTIDEELLEGTYYVRLEIPAPNNRFRLRHRVDPLPSGPEQRLRDAGFDETHASRHPVVALISGCDVEVIGPDLVSFIPLYTPCHDQPPDDPLNPGTPLWPACPSPFPSEPASYSPYLPNGIACPASQPVIQPGEIQLPPIECVMPHRGNFPSNDHSQIGLAAWMSLQTQQLMSVPAPGIEREMRRVAIFAPHGGMFSADYEAPPGNCAMPLLPKTADIPLSGEAEWLTLASDFEPCSYPVLSIFGSVISQHRMLVGRQLPLGTSYVHWGGYRKDFEYPEEFWRANPPWWPNTTEDFWYPL